MNEAVEEDIFKKLNALEKELTELKIAFIQHAKAKKIVSLKGMLKGLKVEEKDIEEAKKSLFKMRA
ncbi:MAG: hypothetical protein ABH874_04670 [Methanobacteriota archaeon]